MTGSKQSVLVTGARGLLGSAVMRGLVDNFTPVALRCDLRAESELQEEIVRSGARSIVHAAAKVDVAACEADPDTAREVNVAGTLRVVKAAEKIGARVLFVSTVSVFRGDVGNYREEDEPKPMNVYNETKREAEMIVLSYKYGHVLRINVIGVHPDGSRGRNFIEWLVDGARAHADMTLFTDVHINPLSNLTIAGLIDSMIRTEHLPHILHLGSADVLSKAEIGKLVLEHFPGYRGVLTAGSVENIADGVWRPKEMWLNSDATCAVLGLRMPTIRNEIDLILRRIA